MVLFHICVCIYIHIYICTHASIHPYLPTSMHVTGLQDYHDLLFAPLLPPYGVFHKWGYPNIDGLYGKIPLKWITTAGTPISAKPPYLQNFRYSITHWDMLQAAVVVQSAWRRRAAQLRWEAQGSLRGTSISIWGFPKMGGTPKSSIFNRISLINHPFWGTPTYGNPHLELRKISTNINPNIN